MSEQSDRARQFMPFASLKGYYDMVRAQEKIIGAKKELSEYKASILSEKLNLVKKGIMIKIVYYKDDGYIKTEGMVSNIDHTMRTITVIKEKIPFDDVYDIASEDIKIDEDR